MCGLTRLDGLKDLFLRIQLAKRLCAREALAFKEDAVAGLGSLRWVHDFDAVVFAVFVRRLSRGELEERACTGSDKPERRAQWDLTHT